MGEKVISLSKHRMAVTNKLLEKAIEESDDKFDFIDEDYLIEHVKSGNVSKETLLQVVWMLTDSMDKLEQQFIKFELSILELLNEAIESGR